MSVLNAALLAGGGGRRRCGRPQGNRLKTAAVEALALNRKHNRIIKDAVERTQERVILTEILPLCRIMAAGKNHVVAAVLLVAAVHHIKKTAAFFPCQTRNALLHQ